MSELISIHFSSGSLIALNICLAIIMFGVALDIKAVPFTQLLNHKKEVHTGLFSQFVLLPLFTVILVTVLPISNGMAFDFRVSSFSSHAQTTNSRISSMVMKD